RWARTYRVCQPAPWFFTIVTHTVLWGVLALLVSRGSLWGWAILGLALATRLGSLAGVMRLLGEPDTVRHLCVVPVRDLFNSLMWAAAFLGGEVNWRGQILRIQRDGRRVPVVAGSEPLPEEAEGLRAAGS